MSIWRKLLGAPDQDIGPGYLHRWHLIPRNRFFNIYLHHFLEPDQGALHDHPWASFSICLKGAMLETNADGDIIGICPGSMRARRSRFLHKIIWVDEPEGCWTLFFTGPRTREWGFSEGGRWIPWHRYTVARTAKKEPDVRLV